MEVNAVPDVLMAQAQASVREKIFKSVDSIVEAYAKREYIGCAIDHESLPDDVRKYARREAAAYKESLGKDKYRFEMAAPGDLYQDYEGQLCLPYLGYMKIDPTKAMKGRQLQGDCVSWGLRTARDIARCYDIDVRKMSEEYLIRSATADIYAERGHTGEGASPSRCAEAVTRIGMLIEAKFTAPDGKVWDFSDYDKYYKIGDDYGKTGLPKWLKEKGAGLGPSKSALIKTQEELLAAFWNGNGVAVGSSIGVANKGGKDGVKFLSALSGSWAHEMAIIGFDARRKYHKDILVIWDQSWGVWNKLEGWPEEYGPRPEGAFVLTMKDTMVAVKGGECHALSDSKGFRKRRQKSLGAAGRV